MRKRLCVHLLARPYAHGRGPALRSLSGSLRTLTSDAPRKQQSLTPVPYYTNNLACASGPRPFAIERIGGRECRLSWSSDGRAGIEREWRDVAEQGAEGGRAVVPTNSVTGRMSSWLGQMFLPTNFPHSVHPSYLTFHVLQFFETTLATITSVLCNQALLTAVGVSAEGSVFGAVAVQWIIKDGAGEVAKLFFIRRFSPYFDSHPKTFTLFGEVLGCVGSGMMIATVVVSPSPMNFLLCAAGGNVFKLVGNAIWFTTHIKFIRYFSTQGNDGDVAAKDEAQASVAQLAGYAAGVGLLALSHAPAHLYAVFALAVPVHLAMTWRMMRGAAFELLTLPRASALALAHARGGAAGVGSLGELERARATGLFGEFYRERGGRWLVLAPRAGEVVRAGEGDRSAWEAAARVFEDDRYLLFPRDGPRGGRVAAFFHPEASTDDMLQAILHAAMLREVLERDGRGELGAVLAETRERAQAEFPEFKQALGEQGWRTDELCFADHGRRVTWSS